MDYKHFIITQFNLRNFPLSENADFARWVDWTRNRIELFRKFCLPSVLNQTNRNFKWLIFFDYDTPAEFNEFIDSLKNLSLIDVCYSKAMEDFNLNYMTEVKRRITESERWVVTTRLDNDDSLHTDAVQTIHENFICTHRFLISLASGYILNIEERIMSHYYYPMSPFLSIIEDAEIELKGIFAKGHTKWENLRLFVLREIWLEYFNRKARKARFVLRNPLWIQTVHGQNVSNSFFRGLPVLRGKDLSAFSLNFTTTGQPLKIIGRYANYVIWKRYFKSSVIKIIINR